MNNNEKYASERWVIQHLRKIYPVTGSGFGGGNAMPESFFEKVYIDDDENKIAIKLKSKYVGLFTDGWISAYGINSSGGSGEGSGEGGGGGSIANVNVLREWAEYDASDVNLVLSGKLGVELNSNLKLLDNTVSVSLADFDERLKAFGIAIENAGEKLNFTTTGTGNAVTSVTKSGTTVTVNMGATFLTQHQDISGKQDVIPNLSAIISNASYGKTAYDWGNHAAAGYLHSSDIPSWALEPTKPNYSWNEIGSRPTKLSEFTDDILSGKYLLLTGGTLSGKLNGTSVEMTDDVITHTKVRTPSIAFADGVELRYDSDNNCLWTNVGFVSESFVSAYGVNTNGNIDTSGETFVKNLSIADGVINITYGNIADIGGGASNVQFESLLDNGVQIGKITIDGTTTTLFAPVGGGGGGSDIPDIATIRSNASLGATAYQWGNHASAGYMLSSAFTKSNITSTLGIYSWALASSKPSYSWSEIGSRPTRLSDFTDDVVNGKYLKLTGGTLSGTLNGTTVSMAGEVISATAVRTPKVVFANGVELRYDSDNNCLWTNVGIVSESYVSGYGVNTNGNIDTSGNTYVKSISIADGVINVVYGTFN